MIKDKWNFVRNEDVEIVEVFRHHFSDKKNRELRVVRVGFSPTGLHAVACTNCFLLNFTFHTNFCLLL